MDLDRAVVGADEGAVRPVLAPIPEVKDVGLKTVEQAVLAGLFELHRLVGVVI
jgi:hypothetical protein